MENKEVLVMKESHPQYALGSCDHNPAGHIKDEHCVNWRPVAFMPCGDDLSLEVAEKLVKFYPVLDISVHRSSIKARLQVAIKAAVGQELKDVRENNNARL